MDEQIECLDEGDDCKGAVEYRMPLSSSGKPFPRCDHHWNLRLDEQERINERYGHPESNIVPEWFDEMDAGERWDDDY